MGGLAREDITAEVELRKQAAPELTRRECDVLNSLCRPALSDEAFVAPATAREIATDLVVTEAAVKQHLLRLYQKFRIAEGPNRRTRLANEVVALGLVRPLPPPGRAEAAAAGAQGSGGGGDGTARGQQRGLPAAGPAAGRQQRGGPGRHLPASRPPRTDRRHGTRLPRGTPAANASPTARQASAQPPNARAIC